MLRFRFTGGSSLFRVRVQFPKLKGGIGETRVHWKLSALNSEEYTTFHDMLLRTKRGTSQIDHVVVSVYGIFVIETKYYKGWIFGHEKSEYWTQTLYHEKNKFRNPIRQNLAHVHALKEVLSDFGHIPFHSIVVFAGSAELKGVTAQTPVIYAKELKSTIRALSRVPVLTPEKLSEVAARLIECNVPGKQGRKEHAAQVRHVAKSHHRVKDATVCPRCGGRIVPRQGRFGTFYGCSNYPRCRYTQK